MGRGFRYQKRTSHIIVEVSEHMRAAADRAAAVAAEDAQSKGVRGAVRKARKAVENAPRNRRKRSRRTSLGQKTHPYGFRLGYNKGWKSRWFAKRDYADLLHEDVALRKQLKER